MNHNIPNRPPAETLQFMRAEYSLTAHGEIYSHTKRRLIGTKANGCEVHDGYKRIRTKGKTYKFHHVVWFLFHGEWPTQQINHLDDNKLNCHPLNLELSDNKSNNAQRWKRWREKHQASLARAS